MSFVIIDKNIPKEEKVNLKEFKKIVKKDKSIRQVQKRQFFHGITYSEGAFSYITTIYIIKVFSNSVSLGIFTSIFSLISCGIGILFAKYIKPKSYVKLIKYSTFFTIVALCIMIYNCSMMSIIIYNLFETFSKKLITLISDNTQANISNKEIIKNKFKVEYWLGTEKALFLGRILSNCLFILMAVTGENIMMYIFVIFLILLSVSSVQLQKSVNQENIE